MRLVVRSLLSMLFSLACALPPVMADNVTVGTGSPASCTEAALNAALPTLVPGINGPGGTLTFNCGNAAHTIPLTTAKVLTDQVTIDGGSLITLDGQNLTRVFTLSVPVGGRTEVMLKNLTIARGFASGDFGGAILANGGVQLTLQQVQIRDSRAGLTGGAIAISPGGNLNISGSRFERNRARDGGAVAASCDVQISDSVFFNNDAEVDQGGALQIWTSTLTASNSRFEFNAALNGGAILQRGGNATLSQVSFIDNQARDRGGAYHVYESGQTAIQGGTFTGNTAVTDGGAVYVAGEIRSTPGQAIGSRMQITNSDLNGNAALGAGGGAYVFGMDYLDNGLVGELQLSNTQVRNNEATNGGGIFCQGVLVSTDVGITNNLATNGGGLYFAPTGNLGSGFVARAELTRTTVSQNTAQAAGGGIWTGPYYRILTSVTLTQNQARYGGAIALFSRSLEVFANISIVQNTATRYGGGVYVDDVFGGFIKSSTFSGNQAIGAQSRGGDLYVASNGSTDPNVTATVYVINTTLLGSVANQGSSVFATDKSTIRLQRSVLFPLIGGACASNGTGAVLTDGANIVPNAGCPVGAEDQTVANQAAIGLSGLTTFADGSQGYLPDATSIALDRQSCDADTDQRGLLRPVDANLDGFALCDSGAIERQLNESPLLFANSFE